MAEADEFGSRFFRTVVERSAVALIVADPSGVVRWHTPTAARFLGGSVIDRPLQSVCDPDDAERLSVYLHGLASLKTPTTVFAQVRVIHGDGSLRHLELSGANLLDDPTIGALVLQITDVTDRVEVERQLTRLAKEDELTGLANRRILTERLEHELARLETLGVGELGLLFLDLDRFKLVNDAFGHSVGDEVLRHVASRVTSCIRPTDMAGRFGGDEFGVVVGGRDAADVRAVADRILEALAEPVVVNGTPFSIGASIGVATTATAKRVDRLFQQADAAMYRAKASGGASTAVYSVDIADWLGERKHTLQALEGRARRLEAENRRLAEEVRTDALTRLPNVVRQREDLQAAEAAFADRGVPYAVAFVDIDKFGLYNKRFGQETGDQILTRVADALANACRDSDTVYRRGGEEFVVIFRNTTVEVAHVIAERMRAHVNRAIDDVTVSIGVAAYHPLHGDGTGTVAAADEAMRIAKRSGGDQVRVAR